MNYDKILVELGEFGPWQVIIALLLWLPLILDGWVTMTASYTALAPEAYRCNIPGCDGPQFEFSDFNKQKMFPSLDQASTEFSPDKPNFCRYYKPLILDNGTCSQEFSSDILECGSSSSFAHDQDTFIMNSTLVTEFTMLCDVNKQVWITMINNCFMVGLGIGGFVFGVLSDKLGRRHSLLIATILCSGGSLLESFMPNYWSYAITRILVGAGSEGCYLVAFTMSVEIVGIREHVPGLKWVSWTTFQGNIILVPFALGEIMVSLAAMVIHRWRDLELALSLMGLMFAFIWFFIPESPRWLISQGDFEKAFAVILTAAKKNGVRLSGEVFKDDDDESEKIGQFIHYGVLDIFNSSVIKNSLALFICWPVDTLLYYGLTFSADKIHLTSNTFLSFIIVGLVEIPSSLFLILLILSSCSPS